jgi:PadR family transcriptional regulator PadR
MTEYAWPSEWLRGFLSVAVLAVVGGGPTYGYAIAAALESGGFGSVKGGTLYPLLTRLENAGLVSAFWGEGDGGPGRKYFTLTESGRAALADQASAWTAFAGATTSFLASRTPSTTGDTE